VAFTKEEEKELIKQILTLKSQGVSVRRAVYQLANNDVKKALRYQNKYRNALKNKGLIEEVVKEIKGNRAVITFLGITVAAVNVKDLTLA
jgi:capsular polysaccharide biosynthesis protein